MQLIHMSHSEREKTREVIHSEAGFSGVYLIMNLLAATIATYGLLANSPAVVIGAMLVALLLGPIMGISLGLVEGDTKLLGKALGALLLGAIGVLLISFVIGSIHKEIPLTDEILNRTAPNLIDLMIAFAGGAVCVFARMAPRYASGLIGAAIATALVPPLAAASILFARGESGLAFGALLLVFTNMVAIQFAASVSLWLVGFRKMTYQKKEGISGFMRSHTLSIVLLLILAVVLTINLHSVLGKHFFEEETQKILQEEISRIPGVTIEKIEFVYSKNLSQVEANIYGATAPTGIVVRDIEKELPRISNDQITKLRMRFIKTTEL